MTGAPSTGDDRRDAHVDRRSRRRTQVGRRSRRDVTFGRRHATRLALVVALAVVVVAGGVAGLHHWDTVQAEREVAAAHAARLEEEHRLREQAERVAAERAAAQRAAARSRARQERLEAAREEVAQRAAEIRPPATQVLAETEGRVADDALRTELATAIDALDAALSADVVQPAVVQDAITQVSAAQAAVVEAHEAWQEAAEAEAEARAAEERAAQERARTSEARTGTAGRSGGAGPDCGGPDSYEPPTGGATFYTSTPTTEGDGSNGRLRRDQMTALDWCVDSRGNAQWLRSDAAAALTRLNEAFRAEFGENIAIDMSYRNYADQVAMREHYGSIAARPGTSNHGWGTAFDTWEWAAYSFGSARYEWLVEHGPSYGWVAPSWARENGSNPEYWHFEYVG